MSDSSQVDDGWSKSASPWIRLMQKGDPNRELLLDEPMLELCGEVDGLDVLDIGCGEGRFCRMLGKRGARITGIDPTEELIIEAQRRQPEAIYHVAKAEKLPLADACIDLVVSYLSLLDIPDYRVAIKEMKRVLKPGGRCVIANHNGFSTASSKYWARDEHNNKLHWTMDNYLKERPNKVEFAGVSVVNWHRPMSAYLQAFLKAGFALENFDEPAAKPEALAKHESMLSNQRVPLFCTMVWRASGEN